MANELTNAINQQNEQKRQANAQQRSNAMANRISAINAAATQAANDQSKIQSYTISTTSGKKYTVDRNQMDWIRSRYSNDMASTYGLDDADQYARKTGQLSAKMRSTYGNSNVDRQLAELGLPSEKNLEKYLGQYQNWHTGGISDYFGKDVPQDFYTKTKDMFKGDWQYDDTQEDQLRKSSGQMPSKLATKYTDTEIDDELRMAGLPPVAEMGKYIGRYNNYSAIDNLYKNAAVAWTNLRLRGIKNDDGVYPDKETGETKTGTQWYADAFYDTLEDVGDDGQRTYGGIMPLFRNNHATASEIDEDKDYITERGKAIVATSKAIDAEDDYAKYDAFSYDDFAGKYDEYYARYFADQELPLANGGTIKVTDYLVALDQQEAKEKEAAYYTVDHPATKDVYDSTSVESFIERYQKDFPDRDYGQMFQDMKDHGVDDGIIKETKRQLRKGVPTREQRNVIDKAYDEFMANSRAAEEEARPVSQSMLDLLNTDMNTLASGIESYIQAYGGFTPENVQKALHHYKDIGVTELNIDRAKALVKERYAETGTPGEQMGEIMMSFDWNHDYKSQRKVNRNKELAADASGYMQSRRETIAPDDSVDKAAREIKYAVHMIGEGITPDALFDLTKSIAGQNWANATVARRALIDLGFSEDGDFTGSAATWTTGWTGTQKSAFLSQLKRELHTLDDVENKYDMSVSGGFSGEGAGRFFGEGADEKNANIMMKDRMGGLSQMEDKIIDVFTKGDGIPLDIGEFEILREWMDEKLANGDATPMELYNALCSMGYQDELEAYDADRFHEAIFKEQNVPAMFEQAAGYERAFWEEASPEERQQIADDIWNNMSATEQQSMFQNYDWKLDPNIYRTTGQTWRQQFLAVVPSVVTSVASGVVGFADMVATVQSELDHFDHSDRPVKEDLWDVTKELVNANAEVSSFGNVSDNVNGAALARIASDATSELIKMYALGSIGGVAGEAFGNATGLASVAAGSVESAAVQKIAGFAIDFIKASPYVSNAIGNGFEEAKMMGARNGEATAYALITGTLEGVLEGLNFDKLWGNVLGQDAFGKMLWNGANIWKNAGVVAKARVVNMLISGLGEATEETASYLAETFWKIHSDWLGGSGWGKDTEWSAEDWAEQAGMGFLTGLLGAGISAGSINEASILQDYYENSGKIKGSILDYATAKSWWDNASEADKERWRNGSVKAKSISEFANLMMQLDIVDEGKVASAVNQDLQKLQAKWDGKVDNAQKVVDGLRGKMAALDANNSDDVLKIANLANQLSAADTTLENTKAERDAAIAKATSEGVQRVLNAQAQRGEIQAALAEHFAAVYLRNESAANARDYDTLNANHARTRQNGDTVDLTAEAAQTKRAEAEANETIEEATKAAPTPEGLATMAREMAYDRVYKNHEAGKAYGNETKNAKGRKLTRVEFAENERQNFQAKTTAKQGKVTLELSGLEAAEGMSDKEIIAEAKKAMTPDAAKKLDVYMKLSKALGLPMVIRDVVAGTSGYVHDGKLYVTLNGKQALLRVTAHELTHYMKDHVRTGYDALRTRLIEDVGGQAAFDELVQKKAQEYGLDVSTEKGRLEADDEVCAELCEKMFENKDALEKFVNEAPEAAKTLKARLAKTLVTIKQAIKSLGTSSSETKADLIKDQSTIELWYKTMSDAIDAANAEAKGKVQTTIEDVATETETTTEAQPQAPPAPEGIEELGISAEEVRKQNLRSELEELAKKGTKVKDFDRASVNEILDRVIVGDRTNYSKADYAQIRGMLAQLIPEIKAMVDGDTSVDLDALNERVQTALNYMLDRYSEPSAELYDLREIIPDKIALTETAYNELRNNSEMTLREASNRMTRALGKFVNFVYKGSPNYSAASTIDEVWRDIGYDPAGQGNIAEDADSLIKYVEGRAERSSYDDLYGSQREDMVSAHAGEFIDAVQSMVEGRSAENNTVRFSVDDDYIPLAERYDAGIATDAEIDEMRRDVEEAASAAGFPNVEYDPVIYDENGEIVPLSERFAPDFTGNRYTVDDDWDEAVRRYGAIEQGREPRARDVQVPRQVDDQTRVSKLIRSGLESATMTDATAEEVKGEIVSDIEEIRRRYSYIPKSNDETLRKARDYISRVGISEARRVLHNDSISGNFNLNMEAVGMQLLWDAAERGDQQAVKELYIDLRPYATDAGQRAQLFNMIKEMKGVGSAWYVENLVKDLNAKYADDIATGAIDGPITVSEDAMNQLRAAKTQAEVDAAEGVVATELAAQLPLTWDEKLSNWRFLSMLGNPVTHIRNGTGNRLMYRMGGMKDVTAASLQRILERTGITDESDRVHAWLSGADKAYWDSFAEQSYEDMKTVLQGGGKLGFQSLLQQNKRSFDNKVLDAIARGKNPGVVSEKGRVAGLFENIKNNGAMGMLEVADAWSLEDNYKRALTEYMKAQGYSLKDGKAGKTGKDGTFTEISPEAMNKAIEWASGQAWTNTFRGPSKLATELNKISKMNPVAKLVVEGVLPFKKTPFNVAKQGFWYSPAGLVTGTVELLTKVKQGKMSAATAIDHMASGLTGTALMALGVVLAKAGIIRGGGEDKKKYETYLEDTGDQTYSFKFGNASINMSAIAPATIPLFMGVALQEMLSRNGDDEGVDLSTITDVLAGTLNPFMEMSFMSSLNSALKNYNNEGIGGALGSTIMTAAQNYGSQYLPTLGGKVAQFIDPTQRTTKSSATSPVGGNMDYYWRSLVKKVPGAEATLQPDVNIWGQTTTKDSFFDWALDFANKFILPTNVKITNRDAVDNELIRVVESTGIVDFLPSDGNKYFTVKGEKYKMNASQYTQYSQERGQAAYAALKSTMASASYKNASDEQRADMLKKALDNAYKAVNNTWKEKLGAFD